MTSFDEMTRLSREVERLDDGDLACLRAALDSSIGLRSLRDQLQRQGDRDKGIEREAVSLIAAADAVLAYFIDCPACGAPLSGEAHDDGCPAADAFEDWENTKRWAQQ